MSESWLDVMTNRQVIAAVNHWQTKIPFHPLTCGLDSRHNLLHAGIRDGKVMLFCIDCDYTQKRIPEIVLATYRAYVPHGCPGCGKQVRGDRMWWGKDGKAWHVDCYWQNREEERKD